MSRLLLTLISLLALAATSCKDKPKSEVASQQNTDDAAAAPKEPEPTDGQPAEPAPPRPVEELEVKEPQAVGLALIWRKSATDKPPFTDVEVTNIFGFPFAPKKGETISVMVSAHPEVEETLTLTKVGRVEHEGETSFRVEVSKPKNKAFLELPSPPDTRPEYLEAVFVYPAVPAKLLASDAIKPESLPKGKADDVIEGAVDWTGDGQADAVLIEYCLKKDPSGACDYTGSRTWWRKKRGWKLIDESIPL
jgi:hypothetical protein